VPNRNRLLLIASAALLAGANAIAQNAPPTPWPRDPAAPDIRRIGMPPLRVTDIASAGETIWVATRNAGVFGVKADGIVHLDIGRPLPSAVAWQVLPLGDSLLVGTSQGVVQIDLRHMGHKVLKPSDDDARVAHRAIDVLRVSPADKRVLLQSRLPAGGDAASFLWRVDEGAPTRAIALPPSATITATGVDRRSDCLLLAGTAPEALVTRLWYASLCADDARSRHATLDPKALRDAIGVSAVALDPGSGLPVLAVVRGELRTPSTLRHTLMELAPDGTLRRHCSAAEFSEEVTGLLPDTARRRLTVALYGKGIEIVDCETPGRRTPLAGDPALRWATALAADEHDPRRLLVGTDTGLFAMQASSDARDARWTSRPLLVGDDGATLPSDLRPTDLASDGRRALVVAPAQGVLELARDDAASWHVGRRWTTGGNLPPGVYGEARYVDDREIALLVRSQGIFVVGDDAGRWLDREAVSSHPHVLGHAADPGRGIWTALGSTPAADSGGVRWYPRDTGRPPLTVRLPGALIEPNGVLLPWADGSVWAATRAGVLRIDARGQVTRLSMHRAQALFRQRDEPGLVGVVGAGIERWTGERFVPVPFDIPPRDAAAHAPLGHPVDVAIDGRGRWTILYSSGQIVLLDGDRRFEALLGPAQGIPASARRLLDVVSSGELLIGTLEEGLFIFRR
jgi:hypothetical protein